VVKGGLLTSAMRLRLARATAKEKRAVKGRFFPRIFHRRHF
jgi:hypothetical protein